MTQTLKRLHALRLKAGHANPTLNKINVGNGWNSFFRACNFQNILGWSMPADPRLLHFISRSAIPIAKLVRGPCSSNETKLLNKSFKYCFAYNYCEIFNTNCLFSGLICLVFLVYMLKTTIHLSVGTVQLSIYEQGPQLYEGRIALSTGH